jgi:hypothetical protein
MVPSNLEQVLDKMSEIFKDNFANYEHEPRRFVYQYKLAEYWLNRENKENNEHILSVREPS